MKIRKANSQDITEITKLNNQEAKWVGIEEPDFFKKYLSLPCFYVAEEKEKLQGFLLAMHENTDYDSKNFLWFRKRYDKFCYIDRVIINPPQRRNGLASELYRKLIKECNRSNILAEVAIDPKNQESIEFHNKFNFKEVGIFSTDGKKNCRMYKLKP